MAPVAALVAAAALVSPARRLPRSAAKQATVVHMAVAEAAAVEAQETPVM
jgi:hypothetical protein